MNLDIGRMATQLIGLLEDRRAVIGVLGMGYVGQPLALRYAELGYKVIGFDIDAEKVGDLNAGRSHIEWSAPTEVVHQLGYDDPTFWRTRRWLESERSRKTLF